jgi:large subunit ribosomal protein L5
MAEKTSETGKSKAKAAGAKAGAKTAKAKAETAAAKAAKVAKAAKAAEPKAEPQAATPAAAPAPKAKPRLMEYYRSECVPRMMQEFRYRSPMQVPKLEKIVINLGLGEAIQNIKLLESAASELAAVTGQKSVVTRAKKSIAAFKLREGMPIGCMVTLRRHRMYDFFDKLVNVVLPRVRDFRGVSERAFDGRGNYTLGIREQIIFPEIDYDKVDKVKGMNITIVTTAPTDEEGKYLLNLLGLPFRRKDL